MFYNLWGASVYSLTSHGKFTWQTKTGPKSKCVTLCTELEKKQMQNTHD